MSRKTINNVVDKPVLYTVYFEEENTQYNTRKYLNLRFKLTENGPKVNKSMVKKYCKDKLNIVPVDIIYRGGLPKKAVNIFKRKVVE